MIVVPLAKELDSQGKLSFCKVSLKTFRALSETYDQERLFKDRSLLVPKRTEFADSEQCAIS